MPKLRGAVRGKYFDDVRGGFRVIEHDAAGDTVFDVSVDDVGRLKWKQVLPPTPDPTQ